MPDQFNESMENIFIIDFGTRQFIVNLRILTLVRNRLRRLLDFEMNGGEDKENIPPDEE